VEGLETEEKQDYAHKTIQFSSIITTTTNIIKKSCRYVSVWLQKNDKQKMPDQ